ncbi:hypothetical protein OQJ18_09875 [Fluoribacter dumoffii]|nr:hypothetical protein [Fluoribacter dumoffii]MCW8386900.1 hypothetical protein [Fluoribacter dumoffii]MCW8417596.1 hypothetical protein [Fluoribacter dumoffii]MCW8454563.1 hypothetical protein [Fluoribacter dumoffii]MCW8484802.1 hypothetical protein [Fluoribacter dumoffii]MCW8497102.1 hypothetical protein [Fluoribacter dumoffii]
MVLLLGLMTHHAYANAAKNYIKNPNDVVVGDLWLIVKSQHRNGYELIDSCEKVDIGMGASVGRARPPTYAC